MTTAVEAEEIIRSLTVRANAVQQQIDRLSLTRDHLNNQADKYRGAIFLSYQRAFSLADEEQG